MYIKKGKKGKSKYMWFIQSQEKPWYRSENPSPLFIKYVLSKLDQIFYVNYTLIRNDKYKI